MNSILAGLSSAVDIVTSKIAAKIFEVNAPRAIVQTISKQSPMMDGDKGAHIDITIEHPAAAAFEWGSGLHSTRGKKGTYEIKPKNASMLAFPKERWPQYEPPPPAPDVFVFLKVDHPGVEKRPFIMPAVEETMLGVKKILGQSMKVQLLMGVKVYEEIK